MVTIPLTAGRHIFGDDPQAYAAARPDYPDGLYQRLVDRCGLQAGATAFEIGPGVGIATRRLLALGASVHAIEPDPRLAEFLRRALPNPVLRVEETTFEESELPAVRFDLGVAATAFHWLEQGPALAKAHAALKPGGWWAMWWNNFGDDDEPDAFQAAIDHLFVGTQDSPSQGHDGRPPFALDYEVRLHDLVSAGFEAAEFELWRWSVVYDTAQLVGLYGTFSSLNALKPADRARFFEQFSRIVEGEFGGRVERTFTTSLYTARRPAADRRPA